MKSVFLKEQKRYTQQEIVDSFQVSEEITVRMLKRLKEYGVLKAVKADDKQKNLSDLAEEDIEVADVEAGENEYYYVFTFVGVITIENHVLKCYPKYIKATDNLLEQLKQVLDVISRYNSKEQIIRLYNETSDSTAFNMLAVMLFLLKDYFEYGSYTNSRDVLEINGNGEIYWEKTINDTFAMLTNGRPVYPEMYTRKTVNDDYDFFKRLHECILTRCSHELEEADLLMLFDMTGVEISDEELDDFGDTEYILERIERELNVQFNTRKQRLLKTMYAYVSNSQSHVDDMDCFSMFGTHSFNLVWESVCSEVLGDQRNVALGNIQLPVPLKNGYNRSDSLISIIDRPIWHGYKSVGNDFEKVAENTLIPDFLAVVKNDSEYDFVILDAKYYNLTLEESRPLSGQPGIESVTKQYLYQLAYQKFISDHEIKRSYNCFLMPTEIDYIVPKGKVVLEMMHNLKLEDIQIRLLPAMKMYEKYLNNQKMEIRELNLDYDDIEDNAEKRDINYEFRREDYPIVAEDVVEYDTSKDE